MTRAAIDADSILKRLDELWRTLAAAEETELLRACAMTLLVFTEGPPNDAALAGSLAELMLAHPFRAIVIGRIQDGGRRLEAEVTARCSLAHGRRTRICCEQIEIGATALALSDLAPIVRGLTVADLPVVAWLRDAGALEQPCGELVSFADKLILDSTAEGNWQVMLRSARALLRQDAALADLAWTRLTPWRLALAEVFDDPDRAAKAGAIERIELQHAPPAPPSTAIYLAAWLRLRLPGAPAVTFAPVPSGEGLCAVRLYAPGSGLAFECGTELLSHFPGTSRLEYLLAEELSLMAPDPAFEAVLAASLG